MKPIIYLLLLLFTANMALAQANINYSNNPAAGNYAAVNGINLYYEVYGEGKPLVLLHGNGGSIASRAGEIGILAKKYQVIAIDSRCHGRSGCGAKELNYEMMADDINTLLEQLKIDSAYVWGHSDGGIIGLIMAFTYPDKIGKLVTTGANIQKDSTALFPELLQLAKMYPMLKDTMMQKHIKLTVDHPNLAFSKLHDIKVPVLLVSGDRDAIQLTHTVEMFRHIPQSQLFIVPGATHFLSNEKPQQFIAAMTDFFDKPFRMPSTVEIFREYAKKMLQ